MTRSPHRSFPARTAHLGVALFATILAAGALVGTADAQERKLALRVNNTDVVPGGLATVVVRTYSPRPISQGQVTLKARRRQGRDARAASARVKHPFVALERVEVLAGRDDAAFSATLTTIAGQQTLQLQFESPSGTINRADGPLAILYLRVDERVRDREEFEVFVELDGTGLVSPDGEPITVINKPGRLRVRAPENAYVLEVEGADVTAGAVAPIGLNTSEPVALSSGAVALRYPTTAASALPTVEINRKYGRARFDVDHPEPGLLVVSFQSRDSSLNLTPGQVFAITLPTRQGKKLRAPLRIDTDLTQLLGTSGDPLPFEFEDAKLRLRRGRDRGDDEFKGIVAAVNDVQQRIELSDGFGVLVDPNTVYDRRGDLFSLDALAAALRNGASVRLEGRGTVLDDGSVLATVLELESDDDGDDDSDDSDDSDDDGDFEGRVTAVNAGDKRVTLNTGLVVAFNGATQYDGEGDLFSFNALANAFAGGALVRIEGNGTPQADGSVVATFVKVETDNDNDDDSDDSDDSDDDGDFEGRVTAVNAGDKRVTLNTGLVVAFNGATQFDGEGDMFSFNSLANAFAGGAIVRIEGDGTPQADGSVVATFVKVETDNDAGGGGSDDDDLGFNGRVTGVNRSQQRATLSGGAVVQFNGSTQFDSEGDLFSFTAMADAFDAGATVRIEGDGTVQSDGALLATSVKVETDESGDTGGTGGFEGFVTGVNRTLQRITLDSGATVQTNGATNFDGDGDLFSFDALADAFESGAVIDVEGQGVVQDDGSILAEGIKVEIDD